MTPDLANDEVQTWRVPLDVPPETSARLYETLSGDERRRSARFRFEGDRRRFIVAHGALREILGRYLGARPNQLRFVNNAFGKPALSPEFGKRLEFNLSHSADLALVAVAADAKVGVDVECVRPQPDCAQIARHFFAPAEVHQLEKLPVHLQVHAFFDCWTKKEAYVKACGEGLGMPLTSFSVPLTTDHGASAITVAPRRWSLYTLRPGPGYIGALAIAGSGWRLSQWNWQSRDLEAAAG